jgi:hypothetical protein
MTGGPGPWVFGAVTVTAFHRPGIMRTIAGYDDFTPEAGTPED